jgi:hypothetical protein
VHAGQVQRHVERRGAFALHREAHPRAVGASIERPHLGLGRETVRDHGLGHERQDLADVAVVDAQHRAPIEGKPRQEIDEGLLQPREVVAVRLHVVVVDVRDHGDDRHQVQERSVRLVGLDDDVVAATQPGIGPGRVQPAADHEGRVESAGGQHAGHEAGGRGLAVRAGDGDALLQPHQFRQHHRARHHGHAAGAGGQDLRIAGGHRGRDHDCVGTGDVPGGVTQRNRRAKLRQPLRGRVGRDVRTADLVPQRQQDLGNAAHSGAADADEVDVLYRVLHVTPSRCTRLAVRFMRPPSR